MNDYLAYRLKLKNEGKPPKQKKRVKIAQYSKKRQRANREYAEKSRPWWQGKQCAIRAPGCTGQGMCIHHMKGKSSIELLMDERWWMVSCFSCNLWVEENDAEARRLGYKISRITNEKVASSKD